MARAMRVDGNESSRGNCGTTAGQLLIRKTEHGTHEEDEEDEAKRLRATNTHTYTYTHTHTHMYEKGKATTNQNATHNVPQTCTTSQRQATAGGKK